MSFERFQVFEREYQTLEEQNPTPVPLQFLARPADCTGKVLTLRRTIYIPQGPFEHAQRDHMFSYFLQGKKVLEAHHWMMQHGPWMCSTRPGVCHNHATHFLLGPNFVLGDTLETRGLNIAISIPVCENDACDTAGKQIEEQMMEQARTSVGLEEDRFCDWCKRMETKEIRHQKCGRCGIAFYCSRYVRETR